ncbi:MAG: COX15/CtaA family protein [Pseudomonadota bacterium]
MTIASIGNTAEHARPETGAREESHAALRLWLLVVGAMIVAMVLVGGATRLTDSGLSITEWKPIHGVIPPMNAAEWAEEFDKYRQIPEYQQINKGMSLSQFQFIYWWEWGHRLLGRAIGVAFAVPLAIFWFAGMVPGWLKPRLVALLALGGLQGAIGWWMVTSGLVERTDVSQYRLAVHLTLAFVILAYIAWLYARLTPVLEARDGAGKDVQVWSALLVAGLVLQVFLGGLVAGLDAGMTFNTWPLMDGAIVPSGLWLMDPVWVNHFENIATVQFQHRMSAYALVVLAGFVAWRTMSTGAGLAARRAAWAVSGLVVAQALTGIVTLLMQVPLSWALMHQGLACLLLIACIVHLRTVTRLPDPAA